MAGLDTGPDLVPAQQLPRYPGVLRDNQIRSAKDIESPNGYVRQIADWPCDDIQPTAS